MRNTEVTTDYKTYLCLKGIQRRVNTILSWRDVFDDDNPTIDDDGAFWRLVDEMYRLMLVVQNYRISTLDVGWDRMIEETEEAFVDEGLGHLIDMEQSARKVAIEDLPDHIRRQIAADSKDEPSEETDG